MNPVIPITADRAIRTAAAGVLFQVGARCVLQNKPSPAVAAAIAATLSAGLCLDLAITFYGPCRLGYPRLYSQMAGRETAVALTFDDGPSELHTPLLLDRLDECRVKATFFLLGENAARLPGLVADIAGRGHAIALHGYSHEALALKPRAQIINEIERTQAVLGERALPYFRPPYGFKSAALQSACDFRNVLLTTWSVNPKDYREPSPAELIGRVVGSLHRGAVVLLHDWSRSTCCVLPDLVDAIGRSGYKIVLLPNPGTEALPFDESCSTCR